MEGRRSSSLSAPVVRNKPPELTVTLPDEEEGPKLPPRAVSHSLLDLIFHRRRSSDASDDKKHPQPHPARSRSPTGGSRCSTPPPNPAPPCSGPTAREARHKRALRARRSSSGSSQEDLAGNVFYSSSSSPAPLHFTSTHSDEADAARRKGEPTDYQALGDFCISSLLRENARASLVDINSTEEEQKKVSGGWVFKELNKDVTILKKMSSSNGNSIISYLCKGLIPTSHQIVWKTLCNPLTRFMYDDTVKKITVLTELPSGQKLIHMYNESVTLLKKEAQDFCLLQTQRGGEAGGGGDSNGNNRLLLALHSVEASLCPPWRDVPRGTVITSGWIVEKVPEMPNATMVSYLMQMAVSSPDNQLMEEISGVQCQCIHNLSTYLATKPTVPKGACEAARDGL